jgi:hypothetical protein
MGIAADIAAFGRSFAQSFGIPPSPDDGWDEIAADIAIYPNACAVMCDATHPIRQES